MTWEQSKTFLMFLRETEVSARLALAVCYDFLSHPAHERRPERDGDLTTVPGQYQNWSVCTDRSLGHCPGPATARDT